VHVQALSGYRLRVRFMDGVEGEVRLSGLIEGGRAGVFAQLREDRRFRQARVELGAVSWPGDLDLAPDAMYDAIRKTGVWAP